MSSTCSEDHSPVAIRTLGQTVAQFIIVWHRYNLYVSSRSFSRSSVAWSRESMIHLDCQGQHKPTQNVSKAASKNVSTCAQLQKPKHSMPNHPHGAGIRSLHGSDPH